MRLGKSDNTQGQACMTCCQLTVSRCTRHNIAWPLIQQLAVRKRPWAICRILQGDEGVSHWNMSWHLLRTHCVIISTMWSCAGALQCHLVFSRFISLPKCRLVHYGEVLLWQSKDAFASGILEQVVFRRSQCQAKAMLSKAAMWIKLRHKNYSAQTETLSVIYYMQHA